MISEPAPSFPSAMATWRSSISNRGAAVMTASVIALSA
jgi:hypothetical protein